MELFKSTGVPRTLQRLSVSCSSDEARHVKERLTSCLSQWRSIHRIWLQASIRSAQYQSVVALFLMVFSSPPRRFPPRNRGLGRPPSSGMGSGLGPQSVGARCVAEALDAPVPHCMHRGRGSPRPQSAIVLVVVHGSSGSGCCCGMRLMLA